MCFRVAITRIQVALVLAVMASRAFADDSKNRDVVGAEALFAEGRRLMSSGNYEAACPKLADSEALDPAPGTALNLAVCYKKQGKLATAWAAFQSAQALATRAGQNDRAKAAKKEAAALEPKLSRLTFAVPETSQVPGLEISCDEHAILASAWGLPLPRDGGGHDIVASAPGRVTWRTHVELKESGERLSVEVPKLEEVPSSPSALHRSPPATHPEAQNRGPSAGQLSATSDAETAQGSAWSTPRVIGLTVGAAGVATIAAGGVLAAVATSKFDTAKGEHGDARASDSATAVHMANTAGVVMGIGAGVAAIGVVVWFVSPNAQTQVGTNGREVLLRGSF
jgi:hypothetical protein